MKSYWQSVSIRSAKDQTAVKSWFGICVDDDDTITKAEILCDKETDREKKIRAIITSKTGDTFQLERSLGARNFTISRKLTAKAPESPADERDRRDSPSSGA